MLATESFERRRPSMRRSCQLPPSRRGARSGTVAHGWHSSWAWDSSDVLAFTESDRRPVGRVHPSLCLVALGVYRSLRHDTCSVEEAQDRTVDCLHIVSGQGRCPPHSASFQQARTSQWPRPGGQYRWSGLAGISMSFHRTNLLACITSSRLVAMRAWAVPPHSERG